MTTHFHDELTQLCKEKGHQANNTWHAISPRNIYKYWMLLYHRFSDSYTRTMTGRKISTQRTLFIVL